MPQQWWHLAYSNVLGRTLLIFVSLCVSSYAQFPAPVNESSLTTIKSRLNPDISVSFKTPLVGTCTTVFSTQKQFSGYVKLPPNILSPTQGNYTINTFFWFIEARQLPESAPFTVFINGGPGSSSMVGLFQEVGPCEVVEVARNRLGTVAREWGWDRSSNILFVDQPVQVGLSYDLQTNATMSLLDELIHTPPTAFSGTTSRPLALNGTFSTGNPTFTANTSQLAAHSLWHFLQTFLSTFPEYDPQARRLAASTQHFSGVNIFTESYGGKYAPAIAKFFRQQNTMRKANTSFANTTLEINVTSLGIVNGWVDLLTQVPYHPRFAYNNTYGIQAISQVQQLNALSSFTTAGGCKPQTVACQSEQTGSDPDGSGTSSLVNSMCYSAALECQSELIAPYLSSGRSIYDISQQRLDPFPGALYLDYLNTAEVQQSIGTRINYTQDSLAVNFAFSETGDYARGGVLDDLADEIKAGTRVALIYGDRDYICNWLGGEAVASALASRAGMAYQGWYTAGYAPIVTNNSYIGGVVREYGNLSFSRIYDAGHLVPAYQPETAFTVYSRIIQGSGISLGNTVNLTNFASVGDPNSTHKNTAPPMTDPKCFIRAVNTTCDADQKNMLANGGGAVINGALYKAESDWKSPSASVASMAGFPGTAPLSMLSSVPSSLSQTASSIASGGKDQPPASTTRVPTGVYTATTVPTTTSTTTSSSAASRKYWTVNEPCQWSTLVRVIMALAVGPLYDGLL